MTYNVFGGMLNLTQPTNLSVLWQWHTEVNSFPPMCSHGWKTKKPASLQKCHFSSLQKCFERAQANWTVAIKWLIVHCFCSVLVLSNKPCDGLLYFCATTSVSRVQLVFLYKFPNLFDINRFTSSCSCSCLKTILRWTLQDYLPVSYTHLTLPTKRIV